jgi:hypothetical protein
VTEFFAFAEKAKMEISNEFSLQHELGTFLRHRLTDYKVQFERNVTFFADDNKTIKKEIDIAIFTDDHRERYAIELKHPRNGQYPEQMYSFVKDIKFMEQLRDRGFTATACVVLVSSRPFYEGKKNEGVYRYFRSELEIYGRIYRPTGPTKGQESIEVKGRYRVDWEPLFTNSRYYVIEV